MSKLPTHYYPRFTRTRAIHVYQPSTPIRAISVWVGDDGEPHSMELSVLGIEVTAVDVYEGPRKPIGTPKPCPVTLSADDIANAGYRPVLCESGAARHRLLVWSDEFGAPEALDPDEGGSINAVVVVGPADRSAEWWSRMMTEAADSIRKRLNIAEPAHLVAEKAGART